MPPCAQSTHTPPVAHPQAFSPEERAALAAMEALLPPDILASTDEETRLICLRGRKYDSERAALLLPHFIQVPHITSLSLFQDARLAHPTPTPPTHPLFSTHALDTAFSFAR